MTIKEDVVAKRVVWEIKHHTLHGEIGTSVSLQGLFHTSVLIDTTDLLVPYVATVKHCILDSTPHLNMIVNPETLQC